MLRVFTESGSTYELSDDRMTLKRVGTGSKHIALPFDYEAVIYSEPIDAIVGERMFLPDGIITTRVVSID